MKIHNNNRGLVTKTQLLAFLTTFTCVPIASLPGTLAYAEDDIEEVVVSGLRGKPRTATDSAVPVDVFSAETISAVSYTDMDDIMQTLVPSYNISRQPISDGATFIRPASLRDLPSHHTLVLINGKRRHRAALVSIGGSGTQGPDLAHRTGDRPCKTLRYCETVPLPNTVRTPSRASSILI